MYWQGRVYFVSDRDGTMNLWTMDENGKGLKQLTRHEGWDVKYPALGDGRIAYQLGADLHVFDIRSGKDKKLEIELASDFDHLRERWIKNPLEYLTSMALSPDGSSVVLTSRGRSPLWLRRNRDVSSKPRHKKRRAIATAVCCLAVRKCLRSQPRPGKWNFGRSPPTGLAKGNS